MRIHSILISALVLTAGCAASTYPLNPQLAAQVGLDDQTVSHTERVGRDPGATGKVVQQGLCSWYGPGFHGRRTSNGEVFDKNALTAAHPTLPFGSQVEVTDTASGKTIRVRINDRGPFVHSRILDLSYAAAARLDILHKGVARVQLRLVDVEDSSEWPAETFALEVATFSSKFDAERFLDGLSASQRAAGLYYVKSPEDDGGDYRVRFGPFTCEETAKKTAEKLKNAGLTPSLEREDLQQEESAGTQSASARQTSILR